MSAGSEEILEQVETHTTLQEALADREVAIGCTARKGKGRHPLMGPKELPGCLARYQPGTLVGIVFGREDRGLENPELDLCNLLLTIPTSPEHTSLNLAQAVLLVCYELGHPAPSFRHKSSKRITSATSRETEQLFQHSREVLMRIGFLHRQNPDRILRVLRRILGRAGVNSREVSILRGILRQMDWYAGLSQPGKIDNNGM